MSRPDCIHRFVHLIYHVYCHAAIIANAKINLKLLITPEWIRFNDQLNNIVMMVVWSRLSNQGAGRLISDNGRLIVDRAIDFDRASVNDGPLVTQLLPWLNATSKVKRGYVWNNTVKLSKLSKKVTHIVKQAPRHIPS